MHSSVKYFIYLLMLCFFLSSPTLYGMQSYNVTFEGIDEPETLKLLESISTAVDLKETPPATNAGLRRRGEADIPKIIKVLHNLTYYNARVTVDVAVDQQPPTVKFIIEKGPSYPLKSFNILPDDPVNPGTFPYNEIELKDLGITLNKPAFPRDILNAEELLLLLMKRQGYPLAKITNREVLADQATYTIHVILTVDTGPICYFGSISFIGHERVSPDFCNKKIAWTTGDVYDPDQIERTQNALESTGLFSSISIIHTENVSEDGFVPIQIQLMEGKQRSIGAGFGYSTDNGLGVLGEWEHRNVCGGGEKVSVKTLVAQRLQEGTLAYVIPDFCYSRQDLIWLAEFQRQTTKGYHASSFSLSAIIERQLNDRLRFSYGAMFKRLRDTHSDHNANFNLLKVPFQLRWSCTDNILDPSQGYSLNLKIVPSLQVLNHRFAYCINSLTTAMYFPITNDKRYILAARATLGSIFGERRHAIPPSERFYAGNEHLLRGYHYMTVSPLKDHEPIGGRSMMIYTLEARVRATESIGYVIFYDFGNVYANYVPRLRKGILQSVGMGLRYNTPVGPLRLDFAVPLDRRRHIDENFQVYLSIGQAF